ITGNNPPALPILAIIMENSPRADKVNPISKDARGLSFEKCAAKYPDATLHITVTTAAKVAQPTAPPKEYISIERPQPKKNMAPKKSLKGSTTASIFFIYFESANTRPAINAPMASAT